MKIRGFRVDGFGVLWNVGVEDLSPGLNIILGDNGAGKTTLLEFFRAMLFGFRKRGEAIPRYEPVRGGKHGGQLTLEMADGTLYRLSRTEGNRVTGQETVVSLADGAPGRDLRELLGGASRDVFEKVFAFSLAELQNFDTLEAQEVQARLYAAGAGTGAASAPEIRRKLEEASRSLYTRGAKSRIPQALAEIEQLEERRRELLSLADRYSELIQERARLNAQLEAARREEADADAVLREYVALDRAWPVWLELQRLEAKAAELATVPPLPEQAETRLAEVESALQEWTRLENEARMRLRQAEEEILAACGRLGPGWDASRAAAFDASQATTDEITRLDAELHAAHEAVTRAEAAVQHAEQAANSARDARSALENEAQQRWPQPPRLLSSIEEDLEALRSLRTEATNLVEERAHRSEMEGRRHAAAAEVQRLRTAPEDIAPPARVPLIIAFGALAGASVVFRISVPAALALLAVFLIAAYIAIRGHRSARAQVRAKRAAEIREAEGRLKDLDDRIAAADESIGKRQAALNEAGARFGVSVVSSPGDLDAAERRLQAERDAAQEFGEFERRLQEARRVEAEAADACDAARVRQQEAMAQRDVVVSRWEAFLESKGLPRGISTSLAMEMVERIRGVHAAIRARDQRQAELSETSRRLDEARQRLAALLAEAGDPDEASLRAHIERWKERESVRAALESARGKLQTVAGSPEALQEMRLRLERLTREDLTQAMHDAEAACAGIRGRREELTRRLGEVDAELRRLETSEEQDRLNASIAEARARATDLMEQWLVGRLCIALLEEAQKKFERERQPAIIRRAGELLSIITNGRYARLFRSIEKNELLAEDSASDTAKGRAAWNRGLLEQVYLCLRLGFIEDYCRSAEPLPVIMDDVCANFDPEHAARTAQAIAGFAEGSQVLYMTCHPETVGLLRNASPAARVYHLRDYDLVRIA